MKFRHIFIVTGEGKDSSGAIKAELLRIMSECGAREADTPEKADMITVLGGDGTIMHASHVAQALDIPLIGVNLGRIGYLAELETGELSRFREVLEGKCSEEHRMMLAVTHKGKCYIALNDAVIHAQSIHLAHVALKCDGDPVNTYRADGLICATSTGSTAYSMSTGGAVVDPRLDCICVTPLCCQALMARPLIFAPSCRLTLRCEGGDTCILTVDGGEDILLARGDEITVERSDRPLRLLKISEDRFYTVLNKKLYS